MMDHIISQLPYKRPFLFVDEILSVSDQEITGLYKVKEDEYFFQGHFPGNPVTPGVIITEIMAQIGLVCFGISLLEQSGNNEDGVIPVFSSSNVEFLAPVKPKELLEVRSEKIYFRFRKLKCRISCFNKNTNKEVARGEFSGMLINSNEFK